jgi:hypothetical protein
MAIMEVIEQLEALNKEQKETLEQLHEQFIDLQADPRFTGLPMEELENLFSAYLKTWISTNTEIIETLLKEEK